MACIFTTAVNSADAARKQTGSAAHLLYLADGQSKPLGHKQCVCARKEEKSLCFSAITTGASKGGSPE